MNNTIRNFTRNWLKENIKRCTTAQQLIFKRMYSHKNLDRSLEDIIDNLPEERLDWAMEQVEKTICKNETGL